MSKITAATLVEQLQWRYAVKKFDPSLKISASDWNALEQSLVLAPSSYGLQPWKFLVVENKETREKLRAQSWNQSQVTDASHLVVFLVKDDLFESDAQKLIDRTAEVRGIDPATLEGFKGMLVKTIASQSSEAKKQWNARQVYISLGQFMAAAAMVGVDTCPLEGLSPAKYDEILGLKGSGYSTICACVAGYRAADDKYASARKVRFRTEDVISKV
jgi:nitroreductase